MLIRLIFSLCLVSLIVGCAFFKKIAGAFSHSSHLGFDMQVEQAFEPHVNAGHYSRGDVVTAQSNNNYNVSYSFNPGLAAGGMNFVYVGATPF